MGWEKHWRSEASQASLVRQTAMASARSWSSVISVVFAEKGERGTLTAVKSPDSLIRSYGGPCP